MKFKVWDEKNKMWLDEEWVQYAVKSNGELIEIFDKKAVDSASHLKPVYSTEKTDKNGVELFEGDIIKGIGQDRLGNDVLAIIKKSDSGAWSLHGNHDDALIYWLDQIEKIGTTFENPELLENK